MLNLKKRFFLCLAAVGLLCVAACDPCRELTEKICDCADTQVDRDNCRKSLDQYPKLKTFELATDTEVCRAKLEDKDCNCVAIRDGQYEKCGITR